MSDKKTFLFYKSWRTLINNLDNETTGILMKAIFDYQCGEDVSIDDPVLLAVFQVIKKELDENDAKYEEVCRKRKEAASKRWDAKESKSMQKNANASKCMQKDTDSECDIDIQSPNGDKKETLRAEKEQKHHHGKSVLLTDKEYSTLIKEFGEAKSEKAIEWLNNYIAEKGYKAKSHYLAIRRWVFDAVAEEERRKAKLEKPVARSGTHKFNDFEQRDNNMDEIEAMMLKRGSA